LSNESLSTYNLEVKIKIQWLFSSL